MVGEMGTIMMIVECGAPLLLFSTEGGIAISPEYLV